MRSFFAAVSEIAAVSESRLFYEPLYWNRSGSYNSRDSEIAAVPMMASARQNHLSDQGIPRRHGTERHNPHCEFVILSINIDTCLLNSKILAGLNLDVLEYFRNLVPNVRVCTAVIVLNLVFEY